MYTCTQNQKIAFQWLTTKGTFSENRIIATVVICNKPCFLKMLKPVKADIKNNVQIIAQNKQIKQD